MKIALVTGSAGLIGSEAVYHFSRTHDLVLGIDNNLRAYFFGNEASTDWKAQELQQALSNYRHLDFDIRNYSELSNLFQEYSSDIDLIVHAAAQPSHDWAAREPLTDFQVNALATAHLLELTRQHCPEACFIFTSTNKVYGDHPNALPLVELETRWELPDDHPYAGGIDEGMSIDRCLHSVFGAGKVAADVLVQEYGRYFGLKTVCFRGGCLTGPQHSGAQLHGFLAWLMHCAVAQKPYTVFGHKGKQVRDNIHSADLIAMFDCFYRNPRCGEVYNAGGGRRSNCSMQEAIALCEQLTGRPMQVEYSPQARIGDHIWYISSLRRFQEHYPQWDIQWGIADILTQMHSQMSLRLTTNPT